MEYKYNLLKITYTMVFFLSTHRYTLMNKQYLDMHFFRLILNLKAIN